MKKRDENILRTYEIRNQFESLIYRSKEDLSDKLRDFCSPEERSIIEEIIRESEEWMNGNEQQNTEEFKSRIETIELLLSPIRTRRSHSEAISGLRKQFALAVQTVSKLHVLML